MQLENKQDANSQINTWKGREATVKIKRKRSLDNLTWSTQHSNKQKNQKHRTKHFLKLPQSNSKK